MSLEFRIINEHVQHIYDDGSYIGYIRQLSDRVTVMKINLWKIGKVAKLDTWIQITYSSVGEAQEDIRQALG